MPAYTSFTVHAGKVVKVENPNLFPPDIVGQSESVAEEILRILGYQWYTGSADGGLIVKKYIKP